jgi:elongation factor P--(R)-beta-lysine ligase
MRHSPLHELHEGAPARTAGRLEGGPGNWRLSNAHAVLALDFDDPLATFLPADASVLEGALVRVEGRRVGERFVAAGWELVHPGGDVKSAMRQGRKLPLGEAMEARRTLNRMVREFFDERGFLEVETPAWVPSPGTDIYLAPFETAYVDEHGGRLLGYLHTSPEFAMKALLCEGFERIYQLCHVWRNGEVTDLHNPEFTILEWYRAWEEVDTIIDEVEALTRRVLHGSAVDATQGDFRRMTMQEVVWEACRFDLLEHLDGTSLQEVIERHQLLAPRRGDADGRRPRWDELFFELVVTHIDPFLARLGAVFVTEWPAPLAVLAKKKADDPRVAERFELYIDGVELANGFGELTDPVEQRARFAQDLEERRALGLQALPMPEGFIDALVYGMPPSSGVAMGVDRLLMLRTGATRIREVVPFALWRDEATGRIRR